MKRDNGLSIYKSWYGTTWSVKRVINIHPTVILWFTLPRVSLLFGSSDDYSSVARLSFNWHWGAKNLWQNYLTKCMSHQLNLSSLEEVVLRELFEWLTDNFHDAFPLSRLYTPWLLSRHVLKLSPFYQHAEENGGGKWRSKRAWHKLTRLPPSACPSFRLTHGIKWRTVRNTFTGE